MQYRWRAVRAVFAVCAVAWLSLAAFCAQGQSTVVGKECDLAVFGDKNTKSFLQFDHDLRDAVEKNDAEKLALLVQYPLMVGYDRGRIYIHDAGSLQGHLKEIFTPAIRKAILSTKRDNIWCNYTGIAYGRDMTNVWVNVTDQGYFVMTINNPNGVHEEVSKGRSVDLACHTKDVRILIDSTPDGVPRFRAWSFSSSLSGPPDIEIPTGKASWGGTGPCAAESWNFQNGNTWFELDGIGCYGEDNPPPSGARAQFVTSNESGKEQKSEWCY
jgi:hypothetical protein